MKLICQLWETSTRGWGVNPDGVTFHKTEEDRKKYADEFLAKQREELGEEVPEEYTRLEGKPFEVEVTNKEVINSVNKNENRWFSNNFRPEKLEKYTVK